MQTVSLSQVPQQQQSQTAPSHDPYRALAVAVLTQAKDEAARGIHDARMFLIGAGDHLEMLDLWTGLVGLSSATVIQWALGKGYGAGKMATIARAKPPVRLVMTNAGVRTMSDTPVVARKQRPIRAYMAVTAPTRCICAIPGESDVCPVCGPLMKKETESC